MQIAVLSPHRDDAAFSCGLTLHALLSAGSRVTIVNVCTISEYAPYVAEPTDRYRQRVTAIRRQEDDRFVEELCRTSGVSRSEIDLIDLTWQDVPLRWRIDDERSLAALDLRPEEVERLKIAFCALPAFDLILVPMALGGHIDHRLVLQAAAQAFPISSLVIYEDLPYACRMSPEERASFGSEIAPWTSEVWLPPQGSAEGVKQAYALCYPSQIANDVAGEMESYASRHGGRERFLAGPEAMRILTAALRLNEALL